MEQLEDRILKYISEHGIAHPKDIREQLSEAHSNILARLESQRLITKVPGKLYSVSLTDEGIKVAELGYIKYLKEKELQNLKQKNREKISYIANLIAIILGILGLIGYLIKYI